MKLYFIPTAAALVLAATTFVSASPAEDFGAALARDNQASSQALRIAIEKLAGDKVDERIAMPGDLISTQNVGIGEGHARIAAEMGVDPANYTNAELAKMYIGANN